MPNIQLSNAAEVGFSPQSAAVTNCGNSVACKLQMHKSTYFGPMNFFTEDLQPMSILPQIKTSISSAWGPFSDFHKTILSKGRPFFDLSQYFQSNE